MGVDSKSPNVSLFLCYTLSLSSITGIKFKGNFIDKVSLKNSELNIRVEYSDKRKGYNIKSKNNSII